MHSFIGDCTNAEWLDDFMARTARRKITWEDRDVMRFMRRSIVHEGDAEDQALLPTIDHWQRQHDA